jgi:ribosomal protein L22
MGLITNIEDLNPVIQEKITNALKTQIEAQALDVYNNLPDKYNDYLKTEIAKAENSMLKMIEASRLNGAILPKISEIYVWNKERKRYLEKLLEESVENAQQPQQMELKDLLPKKLKADEAVEVFQNAIDAQLITNSPEGLKWNETKQLLAYFATKVSDKFNLTTKRDKDDKKTTDWKTFETLFEQKGLKGAKQNWMRVKYKFEPTGFEKVDVLF